MHLQLRIHNRHWINSHLATADGMVLRVAIAANIFVELRVRLDVGAGVELVAAICIEGFLSDNFATNPNAFAQQADIFVRIEIIRVDGRRDRWIRRTDHYRPNALRPLDVDERLKAMLFVALSPVIAIENHDEMVLEIRGHEVRPAFDESDGLDARMGSGPILENRPLDKRSGGLECIELTLQRDRLGRKLSHGDRDMIREIWP